MKLKRSKQSLNSGTTILESKESKMDFFWEGGRKLDLRTSKNENSNISFYSHVDLPVVWNENW